MLDITKVDPMLSISETQAAGFHCDIGRQLAPLREEGVLIIGGGNLVHT